MINPILIHDLVKKKGLPIGAVLYSSDPAGARTQDPNIKSVMLYQLSYGIILNRKTDGIGFWGL